MVAKSLVLELTRAERMKKCVLARELGEGEKKEAEKKTNIGLGAADDPSQQRADAYRQGEASQPTRREFG